MSQPLPIETQTLYAELLERIRLLLIRKRGPKRMQPRISQVSNQIGAA